MSNKDDAFTHLLKKRAQKRSHTPQTTQGVTKPKKKSPVFFPESDWSVQKERRTKQKQARKGFDPSSPLSLDVASPRPSRSAVAVAPRKSAKQGKRVRHLIHVDMVEADNRQAVEDAAAADGRSVSQWCRLVLLRATKHG